MTGVQEQQASKLEKNNPLGKVTDKVKDALSSEDKSGPTNVKSDDIGFKPTDPTGKDGRAVAENDTKSAGGHNEPAYDDGCVGSPHELSYDAMRWKRVE